MKHTVVWDRNTILIPPPVRREANIVRGDHQRLESFLRIYLYYHDINMNIIALHATIVSVRNMYECNLRLDRVNSSSPRIDSKL